MYAIIKEQEGQDYRQDEFMEDGWIDDWEFYEDIWNDDQCVARTLNKYRKKLPIDYADHDIQIPGEHIASIVDDYKYAEAVVVYGYSL